MATKRRSRARAKKPKRLTEPGREPPGAAADVIVTVVTAPPRTLEDLTVKKGSSR
jgi:hypothetical protein